MTSHSKKQIYLLLLSLSFSFVPVRAAQGISAWKEMFGYMQEGKSKEIKRLLEDKTLKLNLSAVMPKPIPKKFYEKGAKLYKLRGSTIIHAVPYQGNEEILIAFLDHDRSLLKQTINKENKDNMEGFNLFHILALEGKEGMMDIALAYEKTDPEVTAAILSTWFRGKYIIKDICHLITKYAENYEYSRAPVSDSNRHHKSQRPIHIAALRGHHKIVKKLLEHDPSSAYFETALCFTPFFLGLRNGHTQVVKELLAFDHRIINQRMGDSPIKQYAGMNAFHMVAYEDYEQPFKEEEEILDILFKYDTEKIFLEVVRDYEWEHGNFNALHIAIYNRTTDKTKVIAIFLKKAFSLAKDVVPKGRWAGYYPLHIVTGRQSVAVLKKFLIYDKKGILLKARTKIKGRKRGYTALHIATQEESGKIIRMLLDRDPSLANEVIQDDTYHKGFNAIQLATLTAHITERIAEIFLEKAPSCIVQVVRGYKKHNGLNVFHLAMQNGIARMMGFLLEKEYEQKDALLNTVIEGNIVWNGYNAFLMAVKIGFSREVDEMLRCDASLIDTVVQNPASKYNGWDALKMAQRLYGDDHDITKTLQCYKTESQNNLTESAHL
ncbi:MAG: ankyrin repeat domain-containing protein [Bacteroidota bacterium]